MEIRVKTIMLATISALTIFSASGTLIADCDRTKQPWLNDKCEMPDKFNPNDACRYAAYIKANNIDPNDPALGVVKVNGKEIASFKSFEKMAVETCAAAKQIRCTESERLLIEDYSNIQKSYIENVLTDKRAFVDFDPKYPDSVDVNLQKNFVYLADKNKAILLQIEAIVTKAKSATSGLKTTPQLKEAESLLVKDFTALRPAFLELSERERSFRKLLDSMVNQITFVGERSLSLSYGYNCDFGPESAVQKYSDDLKELLTLANELQKEISEAATQRQRLFAESYLKWKYALFKNYADYQIKQIDQVLDGFYRDMVLEKLLWRIGDWWISISVNGMAGRLHTKYYMHTEPLRILKSQREQAQKFKDQVSAIAGLEAPIRDQVFKDLDDKISIINSGITFIESRGWSGLLASQKANAAMKSAALPNNNVCQDKVKTFLDTASKVNSVEGFDNASPLFKLVVDKCVR